MYGVEFCCDTTFVVLLGVWEGRRRNGLSAAARDSSESYSRYLAVVDFLLSILYLILIFVIFI